MQTIIKINSKSDNSNFVYKRICIADNVDLIIDYSDDAKFIDSQDSIFSYIFLKLAICLTCRYMWESLTVYGKIKTIISINLLKYLGVVKFSINIIVQTCLQVLTITDYMINDYFILVYIIYTTIIKRRGL